MGNEKNLKPIKKGQRTKEEQKEFATKGGIASGEARRRKRDMRQTFESLFAMQTPEKMVKAFKKQGIDVPEDLTNEQALAISMMMKAMAGDARMVSLVMDVTGDKFSDKMRERELEFKEKQGAEAKNEALERLDSILEELRNEAEQS